MLSENKAPKLWESFQSIVNNYFKNTAACHGRQPFLILSSHNQLICLITKVISRYALYCLTNNNYVYENKSKLMLQFWIHN